MTTEDLRPRLREKAMLNEGLSSVERHFLLMASLLPAQFVDGARRSGSQGMGKRGHFALHYDYLAEAMHTSPANVKKLCQRLTAKGYLSKVHPGTFGRPACFQALSVRGDRKVPITLRPFVPPYVESDPTTRGDTVSPLPCSTPDRRKQPRPSGVSGTALVTGDGSNEETEGRQAGGRPADPWWLQEPPEDREASA